MKLSERQSNWPILVAYLLGLAAVYFALHPGLGISFHFDTYPNLEALGTVHDFDSAMLFTFTGAAGPLGRPLALLTFLLQADSWPNSPGAFLFVNLLIHLLNGLLLAGVTWGVARLLSVSDRACLVAATVASLLWLVSPILLTTTFSAIQRMTSLAATFMLLGVAGHLLIRARAGLSDRQRLTGLSLNLAIFTALAALSKENGLILPVLILAIEFTLLGSQLNHWQQARAWQVWKLVFLWVPMVLMLGYLASRAGYSDAVVVRRGFTTGERLMTQSVVLWEYLLHTMLPALRNIGFFHDDYQPVQSIRDLKVVASVAGWLIAVVAAFALRHRWPLFSFAVLWYLGAHLIESSTVPLELYFEHRSYVPLMGVFIALGVGLVRLPAEIARTAGVALGLYFVMLLAVSWSATSLWARGLDAAEFWLEKNPESERAVTYYVREQTRAENPLAAYSALVQARDRIDSELFLVLSQLWLQCHYDELPYERMDFTQISGLAEGAKYHAGTLGILVDLYELIDQPRCDHISRQELFDLTTSLLENRGFTSTLSATHTLNRLTGSLLDDLGQRVESISFYESAVLASVSPPIVRHLNNLYQEFEMYERGCAFFDRLMADAPRHPYVRSRWLGVIRANRRELGRSSPVGDCRMVIPDSAEQ